MTVVHSNYTSLEDAWGPLTGAPDKKKKSKSAKADPLCELYGRRYKKSKKPFYTKDSDMMENDYINRVHGYSSDTPTDPISYHGYKDDPIEPPGRRRVNLPKCSSTTIPPRRKSKKKRVNFLLDPDEEYEEDDDVYIRRALLQAHEKQECVDDPEDFDKVYSNVYNETDDEGFEEENNADNQVPHVNRKSSSSEPSIKDLVKQELRKTDAAEESLQQSVPKTKTSSSKPAFLSEELSQLQKSAFVDERQYLDMLMYVFSGIILIFMMEQFIQIGIRMKENI